MKAFRGVEVIAPVDIRDHGQHDVARKQGVSVKEEANTSHEHDNPLESLSVDRLIDLSCSHIAVSLVGELPRAVGLVQAEPSHFGDAARALLTQPDLLRIMGTCCRRKANRSRMNRLWIPQYEEYVRGRKSHSRVGDVLYVGDRQIRLEACLAWLAFLLLHHQEGVLGCDEPCVH